jgi:protoheme IX farnesyltransferase
LDYISVLKPRETSLLVYIGTCTALVAASVNKTSFPTTEFVITIVAIMLGSAGANGLTNYLDRDVDALMKRTCSRVLPSRKIYPPQKALPLIILCIAAGLVLAWILSPLCFAIGLIGMLASGIGRKTITCTYLGIIAGSAPVLIGWYAIAGYLTLNVLPALYFCLIAAWTPLHVWTLMIANRSDYEGAGLHYFPLSWKDKDVIKLLVALSVLLSGVAVMIYFASHIMHWSYLVTCLLLSTIMVGSSLRLLFATNSRNSWLIYKFTAFPYLGIIFTVMAVDAWL